MQAKLKKDKSHTVASPEQAQDPAIVAVESRSSEERTSQSSSAKK